MVRVGPVYTPPERRGRGYAGAVTVAVSQASLDAGVREVVLYTDLANPTSNALYQRLGYRPVEDRVIFSFEPGGQGRRAVMIQAREPKNTPSRVACSSRVARSRSRACSAVSASIRASTSLGSRRPSTNS